MLDNLRGKINSGSIFRGPYAQVPRRLFHEWENCAVWTIDLGVGAYGGDMRPCVTNCGMSFLNTGVYVAHHVFDNGE